MRLFVTCSFVFPNLYCIKINFTGNSNDALIQSELYSSGYSPFSEAVG